MMIKISDFREFKLGDIFEKFEHGKCSDSSIFETCQQSDFCAIPYIGAKKSDNGLMKIVKVDTKNLISEGNVICFIGQGEGSNGYNNYFDEQTIQTTSNWLGYTKKLNLYSGLFMVCILDFERFRWSFGRTRTKLKLMNTTIKLPAKKNKDKWIPNWEYMENYVKNLFHNEPNLVDLFRRHNATKKIILNIDTWHKFKIGDIFDFPKIKKFSLRPKNDGNIPYITSKSFNQGVDCYISTSCKINNVITISTNGACFDSFYHDEEISISSDVEIIRSNLMNKFSAMFVCTILNLEKKKWGYGRKPKNHSINNTIIKLPAKKNKDKWEVDWKYMEDYIKSLPLSYKLGNH